MNPGLYLSRENLNGLIEATYDNLQKEDKDRILRLSPNAADRVMSNYEYYKSQRNQLKMDIADSDESTIKIAIYLTAYLKAIMHARVFEYEKPPENSGGIAINILLGNEYLAWVVLRSICNTLVEGFKDVHRVFLQKQQELFMKVLYNLRYMVHDISELYISQLLEMFGYIERSIRDYKLTELYNKHSLTELYNYYVKHASGSCFSVIITDVDFFKKYNDLYGHIDGDKCLKTVAGILGSAAEKVKGMPGRWGGEEFVIILPRNDKEGALLAAQSIREAVERAHIPHADSEVADHVTLSIGTYSFYPDTDFMELEKAIERADEALYKAKGTGRDTVVQYEALKSTERDEGTLRQEKSQKNENIIASEYS